MAGTVAQDRKSARRCRLPHHLLRMRKRAPALRRRFCFFFFFGRLFRTLPPPAPDRLGIQFGQRKHHVQRHGSVAGGFVQRQKAGTRSFAEGLWVHAGEELDHLELPMGGREVQGGAARSASFLGRSEGAC
jgi:hypothetical protein